MSTPHHPGPWPTRPGDARPPKKISDSLGRTLGYLDERQEAALARAVALTFDLDTVVIS